VNRGALDVVMGLMLVLLSGCGGDEPSADGPETTPAEVAGLPALPSHGTTARSPRGMVVTGSPHATEAGRRMLAVGGNAVDAAVAAAFALAVAEPTQSGLGGRTQLLLRHADGRVHAVDGTTQVPAGFVAATDPDAVAEVGLPAVAIPGTVAALTRVLEEHGSLSLATVLEPARTWAAEGLELTPAEATRLADVVEEAGPDSEVARTFGGVGPGRRLVQPDLAGVLEMLAQDGRAAFYEGAIAQAIVADMEARGGVVSARDLSAYRAEDGRVGRGRFQGHEVVGSYLPASGVTVVEILQILDRLELPDEDTEPGRWAATLAEALTAGFEDREQAELLPAPEAVAWLTSDSLAERRAQEIAGRLSSSPVASSRPSAAPTRPEPPFTTHVSVADAEGMGVALTQSLGPTGGARVVTPGLGFLYASTLGGYLAGGAPGYRPWSSQAPLLVLDGSGPRLVVGGAGARRILSAEVATLVRVLAGGRSVAEALSAPRLHPTGGEVRVAEGWAASERLTDLGYSVGTREPGYFARLNVVERTPQGLWVGHADERWSGGGASGPERSPR